MSQHSVFFMQIYFWFLALAKDLICIEVIAFSMQWQFYVHIYPF
jgi:hypothetical protein